MPGVVEHGLFIGRASVVLFARGNEIVELRPQASAPVTFVRGKDSGKDKG
jgi:hypothetical protein